MDPVPQVKWFKVQEKDMSCNPRLVLRGTQSPKSSGSRCRSNKELKPKVSVPAIGVIKFFHFSFILFVA